MAATSFAYCERTVLVFEGGKVNNPKDPGGRTNQGVIQRVYDGWRRRKGLPLRSVYDMEAAERDDIYRNQYWTAVRGDELPAGVDLVVYDGAVNSGPVQSIKWLQRALGLNAIDGHVGEATLRALDECTDLDGLVRKICARRLAFLKSLRTWGTFGAGWSRRVAAVQRAALTLAEGAAPGELQHVEAGNAKAMLSDAKAAPQTALADTSAGGGVATATLTQATTALQPLVEQSHTIAYLFTGLTVAGVLLTIGGLLWGIYARNKRAQLHDALDLAPLPPPDMPADQDTPVAPPAAPEAA